jgi:lipopolysaccharide transport system ATP-binding protein
MISSYIELSNVEVVFPIYNAITMSLKNRLLSAVTGGKIDRQHDGVILVKALKDINLVIKPGERVGLLGHNGSGKTTLLRVLSGIYQPTNGTAQIKGECVSLINIGLGIDPEATGRDNIFLRGVMMGMHPSAIKAISEDIIEFTGLGDFIDLPFRTYSTGMQLRLAFAVSTAVRPKILIMDEWLSTGDEEFKERADRRMSDVVSAAEILIVASHSRELLLNNCSRLIWLEHGKIKIDGEPKEILSQYFGF